MSELLLAALERVSPRVRRLVIAVGVLLALGVVMAALTLSTTHVGYERRPAPQRPTASGSQHISPRRLPPPVSTGQLALARGVGERFLGGYLRFAYGRGSALAVSGMTPALRRRLQLRERARLTPVERRRRPRVVSLQTIGTTPTFVVATAVIDDGGVTTYRLRFTLQPEADRWAVSSVAEG